MLRDARLSCVLSLSSKSKGLLFIGRNKQLNASRILTHIVKCHFVFN